jgi:hypothetical protein
LYGDCKALAFQMHGSAMNNLTLARVGEGTAARRSGMYA